MRPIEERRGEGIKTDNKRDLWQVLLFRRCWLGHWQGVKTRSEVFPRTPPGMGTSATASKSLGGI